MKITKYVFKTVPTIMAANGTGRLELWPSLYPTFFSRLSTNRQASFSCDSNTSKLAFAPARFSAIEPSGFATLAETDNLVHSWFFDSLADCYHNHPFRNIFRCPTDNALSSLHVPEFRSSISVCRKNIKSFSVICFKYNTWTNLSFNGTILGIFNHTQSMRSSIVELFEDFWVFHYWIETKNYAHVNEKWQRILIGCCHSCTI